MNPDISNPLYKLTQGEPIDLMIEYSSHAWPFVMNYNLVKQEDGQRFRIAHDSGQIILFP